MRALFWRGGAAVATRARALAALVRAEWEEAAADASVRANLLLLLARVSEECDLLAAEAEVAFPGGEGEVGR